ncbi:IS1096 element passenger TnpR family protein [Rhizobium leguminosarum]|uniref:IS1096 element passenger TnpR family protein n=1 Tax=Rhizobium leguminosarum TaxID=384 RepID=UPI0035E432D0
MAALIERGIATFSNTYDFGDNWRHTITVEAVEDGNPSIEYPRFIDGERRAPPEVGLTGLVTILTTPSSICRRRGRAENFALSVIDVAEAVRQTAIEIIAAALLGKMRN